MAPKRLPLGKEGWYLCEWNDRPDFEYRQFQGGEAVALQWLRKLQRDTALMGKLRGLAGGEPGRQISDDEVLRRLAWQICTGRLKALQRTEESGGGGPGPQLLSEAPAFPLEERRAATPAPSSKSDPDPPLLPGDADLIAIAESLTVAARKGIPICVECEKAKQDERPHVFVPIE